MRISILECLTGQMISFFLSEINVFCIAKKFILSIAIILHWRLLNLLLSLAGNNVHFHRHSGKEMEFSWRGRRKMGVSFFVLACAEAFYGAQKTQVSYEVASKRAFGEVISVTSDFRENKNNTKQ